MASLFEYCGTLPNGQCVKVGDVVKTIYGPGYTSFNKVIEVDGTLSIENHFMYSTVGIGHFISQGGEVEIVRPKDVYLFCRKNDWPTQKYLMYFK